MVSSPACSDEADYLVGDRLSTIELKVSHGTKMVLFMKYNLFKTTQVPIQELNGTLPSLNL